MSLFGYFLGFLGMLQAILLPGLCLTASLKSWNWLQRTLIAPPLSLLINYYLAWIFVSLGIYQQATMAVVITFELAWILYRFRFHRPGSIAYAPVSTFSELLFLTLGFMSLTKFSQAWVREFGDVFQLWDAVVSWNAWGRSWFEGTVAGSGLYPNALPITFSLPYVLMDNTSLEEFSKASTGIIYLFGLSALLELGFRRKDLRHVVWLSTFVYSAIQSRFLQSHWNSGYADVPLALMLIFAFCVSFMDGKETPRIFGLLAGTAPLVKQPGLLLAAVSAFIISERKKVREQFWPVILCTALAAGPWYLFILSRVLQGRTGQSVFFLANLVHGGLLDRWRVTFFLLLHFAGAVNLITWTSLLILGCFVSREARRWWMWLGLPYFLVWSIFFAYDIRNISMSLFPLALAISAGLTHLMHLAERKLPLIAKPLKAENRWLRASFLGRSILAITLLLAVISLRKPIGNWAIHGGPLSWEKEQRIYLGDSPRSNKLFVELAACETDPRTAFFTNYWWPLTIPPIKNFVQSVDCDRLAEAIRRQEKSYVYLYSPTCDLQVDNALLIHEENGLKIFATHPDLKKACGEI